MLASLAPPPPVSSPSPSPASTRPSSASSTPRASSLAIDSFYFRRAILEQSTLNENMCTSTPERGACAGGNANEDLEVSAIGGLSTFIAPLSRPLPYQRPIIPIEVSYDFEAAFEQTLALNRSLGDEVKQRKLLNELKHRTMTAVGKLKRQDAALADFRRAVTGNKKANVPQAAV